MTQESRPEAALMDLGGSTTNQCTSATRISVAIELDLRGLGRWDFTEAQRKTRSALCHVPEHFTIKLVVDKDSPIFASMIPLGRPIQITADDTWTAERWISALEGRE